jgi:hypothetical protein
VTIFRYRLPRHWTLLRQKPKLSRCAVPRLDARMRLGAMVGN